MTWCLISAQMLCLPQPHGIMDLGVIGRSRTELLMQKWLMAWLAFRQLMGAVAMGRATPGLFAPNQDAQSDHRLARDIQETLWNALSVRSVPFCGVEVVEHEGTFEATISCAKPSDWQIIHGHAGSMESEFQNRFGANVLFFGDYVTVQKRRQRKSQKRQSRK